jgi:hypothetical protein
MLKDSDSALALFPDGAAVDPIGELRSGCAVGAGAETPPAPGVCAVLVHAVNKADARIKVRRRGYAFMGFSVSNEGRIRANFDGEAVKIHSKFIIPCFEVLHQRRSPGSAPRS